MNAQRLFQQAVKYHQGGRHLDAARLYRDVMRQDPRHFDALHLLGVLHVDRQDYAAAARCIESALVINPNFAAAHYNPAISYSRLARYDDALASFDRAIRLRPAYPEAWNGWGIALTKLDRCGEAVQAF